MKTNLTSNPLAPDFFEADDDLAVEVRPEVVAVKAEVPDLFALAKTPDRPKTYSLVAFDDDGNEVGRLTRRLEPSNKNLLLDYRFVVGAKISEVVEEFADRFGERTADGSPYPSVLNRTANHLKPSLLGLRAARVERGPDGFRRFSNLKILV